jgi:hypothetical protein
VLVTATYAASRYAVPPPGRYAAPSAATPAMNTDISGPAAATRYSPVGVAGSRSISAAPPSRNSVTRRTGSPSRSDTTACASSCASTDAASSTAAAAAVAYAAGPVVPPRPNSGAMPNVMSTAAATQLGAR